MDWIELTHNRMKWLVFEKVMNLRLYKNKYFLDHLNEYRLLKKTLFNEVRHVKLRWQTAQQTHYHMFIVASFSYFTTLYQPFKSLYDYE